MTTLNRRDLIKLGAAGWIASALPGVSPADETRVKDGFLEPEPAPPST